MTIQHLAARHAAACDAVDQIRESLVETTVTCTSAALSAAKDRQLATWTSLHRACEAALDAAPVDLRRGPHGIVYATQAAPGVGGRSQAIGPQHPQHAAASAALDQQQRLDAAVAEIAFALWGWRGGVRIDYYGATALVSRGAGRRVRVDLRALAGAVV